MKTALDNFLEEFTKQVIDIELKIQIAETEEEKEQLLDGLEELLKAQMKLEQLIFHRRMEHSEPKTK
jgi:hypothetical protein